MKAWWGTTRLFVRETLVGLSRGAQHRYLLIGLACEDDPVEDGSQKVADRYRLGCVLLHRLRRTLEYEPDRPLVKYLAKGLHTTRCLGIPEWGTETREDLQRLWLDDEPPKRIGSKLCPTSRE